MKGKPITMEELHQIQLDILIKVHDFCVTNNLRYSLGGGTLLGAVRHKGYIPWDDDIDIMMPRPDYDRFCKDFIGRYDYLVLQNYKTDFAYGFPFAKVYNKKTSLVEAGAKNGIYVDVFPIDGLPEDDNMMRKYLESFDRYIEYIMKTTQFFQFQKGLWMRIKYTIKCLVYPKRSVCIERLEQLFRHYLFDNSKRAGAITGRYREAEIMDSDVFYNYIMLPFEGHNFYCISKYDAYLTKHYGNYMQLPPKEKQISNHNYEAWWNE